MSETAERYPDSKLQDDVTNLERRAAALHTTLVRAEGRLSQAEARMAQTRPTGTPHQDERETRTSDDEERAVSHVETEWAEILARDDRLGDRAKYVMEKTLSGSATDRKWTQDVRLSLDEALGQRGLANSGTYDVDCKEHLCRVEASHTDAEVWKQFRDLLGKPPLDSDLYYRYEKDTQTTFVYFARQGERLPAIPPDTAP